MRLFFQTKIKTFPLKEPIKNLSKLSDGVGVLDKRNLVYMIICGLFSTNTILQERNHIQITSTRYIKNKLEYAQNGISRLEKNKQKTKMSNSNVRSELLTIKNSHKKSGDYNVLDNGQFLILRLISSKTYNFEGFRGYARKDTHTNLAIEYHMNR